MLPKNISKQELQSTMPSFAFALGVRCEHCHVEKKAPEKGFDYSADDKDTKKTARVMLQMVEATNRDYVGKIEKADKTPPIRVQCVTCRSPARSPQQVRQLSEKEKLGPAALRVLGAAKTPKCAGTTSLPFDVGGENRAWF